MTAEIKVTGLKETRRFLAKKEKQVTKEETEGIKNAAFFMQSEVKSSIAGRRNEPTSVDTGRFLNSVDVVLGKDNAVIFSPVGYAKILEFGASNRAPRKHFNNSKDRNKEKVRKIIQKEIDKV